IELCKRSGIKKYSSKFHNRLYDNYQFMVLLCLKQKSGVGYKAFIEEELIEWPHVVEFLKLKTIPHPDTLNKFATSEYIQRKNRKKKRRGRPRKKRQRKKYIYVQIMVELRTQMPLGVLITRKPADDYNKFKPLAKKVMKLGKAAKIVVLDKGYDAEKVHEFIREVMEALSIIPARNENIPIHKTKGKYRKLMKKGYSKKKYYQRNKNETVNSVVKRKWSDGTFPTNLLRST
ncbi:hypothetical protein B6U93_01035, partial [Candidatus Woesearchaeota archaeon ex4484_78]